VSDPRLVAENSPLCDASSTDVGYYRTSRDKHAARFKRAWETWRNLSPALREEVKAALRVQASGAAGP